MKIIVDAFGGDNAPLEILKGCAKAVQQLEIEILLTGRKKQLCKSPKKITFHWNIWRLLIVRILWI